MPRRDSLAQFCSGKLDTPLDCRGIRKKRNEGRDGHQNAGGAQHGAHLSSKDESVASLMGGNSVGVYAMYVEAILTSKLVLLLCVRRLLFWNAGRLARAMA